MKRGNPLRKNIQPRSLWSQVWALALLLLCGCLTTKEVLAPINLSQPGWTVRQGQAVWKVKRAGPEIAGEIVLAHNEQARSWIQFSKTPLPMVTAQLDGDKWQCEFHSQEKIISGHGKPPAQLLWPNLLQIVNNQKPEAPLKVTRSNDGALTLENTRNGEMLTIYLNP